jgi:3-dehydroquinate synthase
MVAAARLANKLDMLEENAVARITALIAAAGLPISGLTLDVGRIVDAMSFDKKVKAGRIRFVLPDRIGHVVIRDDVKPALVREAVESLKG